MLRQISAEERSPKAVRQLLKEGFNCIGAGRGRIVFGKPGDPAIYKVSWRKERTGIDMNEQEWNYYQSLPPEKQRLIVPLLGFKKLSDGNSVLAQAAAETVNDPTQAERAQAEKIIEALHIVHDHISRNFGYYNNELRILDADSPCNAT